MLRVLIVEPESSGHHFSLYLKLIVRSLNNKFDIHLLTKEDSILHPAYETVLRECNGKMTTHLLPSITKTKSNSTVQLFIQQCKLYFCIKNSFDGLVRKFSFDKIFLVNLDHIEKPLSLFGSPFGSYTYAGIFMNPKFHKFKLGIGPKSRNDKIYEFLFNRLLKQKTLNVLGTVDEIFADYFKLTSKVLFIPEPYDLYGNISREIARDEFKFRDNHFVILVYGDLTLRKGIRELIDAVIINRNKKICLHFVGKTNEDSEFFFQEEKVIQLINEGLLLIRRGFQSEIDQYKVFVSSDLVWVGYIHGFSGSSGVYYQAASLGIPVITNDFGLLGWLVNKHKNGLLCDVFNPESVNSSINVLVTDRKLYKKLSENALLLSERHQPEIFGNFVFEMIVKH